MRRAWDMGNAVLPVDPRLPHVAQQRLLDAMAPSYAVVVDGRGHVEWDELHGGRPVEPGDALVMATSGTTGEPKGVVLTHDAVAASARATSTRLGVDPTHHRWLACLPLAHVGGLSVVTRAIATGTPFEVHDGFHPSLVADAARRGATHVSLVATALQRIDPSAFRCIVLGGAAPPADLPANVVTTYGMTETGSGVVYDGVPLDGVEVRAVGGELQIRGPMLLRAYRDGTDPKSHDGWLPTGDLGEVDPTSGLVRVFGRSGDLIITGGENVWPAAVERVLHAHAKVAEVAVVGRPDPEWGHRVVAVVVPADPHDPPTLAELRDHAKGQLPAFAAPREVDLVDALPRTPLGKVVRRDL
ncbi:AMP-binding protein [Actinomarinicola tropica]|uniref:AMP-binding protein n=1 Tax=Actinomarinicola tropica TaxID=2789776 RepID=A0A5Q2RT36_9ACTN|nr:AMP-binding protein [Actinomarinicola tropica]